ncbi:MAG: 2-C-methyl-D-erythritol 2,4-cyclodiphosphate synthase, partial [Nitrospirae bacterium]|nr:2-C-methyl-D-erythritol 2,4-cyclodiphosphate synthase [Nitrospirota bacterium]
PKIDPLVSKMKKSLAEILDLNTRRIGITATSGEKCTVFGEGLGVQCFAIASIVKEKTSK